jgi:stage V sporulation protein SpoVS
MAWAIVRSIQNGHLPIMRALGHGAVGQAVKAQIIARGLAAPLGLDLLYLPCFDNVLGEEGKELSVIVWRVLWR